MNALYEKLIPTALPTGLLLEVFKLPDSRAIGFNFIATPWTDSHLDQVEGCTAAPLQLQQLDMGLHVQLVEALHLRGFAYIPLK